MSTAGLNSYIIYFLFNIVLINQSLINAVTKMICLSSILNPNYEVRLLNNETARAARDLAVDHQRKYILVTTETSRSENYTKGPGLVAVRHMIDQLYRLLLHPCAVHEQ
jgi:hypothetical protein